jgi:hypothetical protein
MKANNKYDINIMYGFAIVGIIIKLFFGDSKSIDGNSGRATAAVWGYGTILLSLLGILIISFSFASLTDDGKQTNIFEFLKKMTIISLPTTIMILLLAWEITLNIIYYKKINKGTIATEYYDYSKVTTFLILSQLIILFLSLLQDETPNKFTYSSYFIALLIIIFIGINNIILTYFSTDG